MHNLSFVTGSSLKFANARHAFQNHNIDLLQKQLEIDEIQGDDIERIARRKSADAYNLLQQPLITNDDFWQVPGLNGFPGAYAKEINQWFTPDDWLRLTSHLEDRRIFLIQTVVYQDAAGQQLFRHETAGTLLTTARGESRISGQPIATMQGDDGKSLAEVIASGAVRGFDHPIMQIWQQAATWFVRNKLS